MKNTNLTLQAVRFTAERCIDCGICISKCRFLQQFGSPKKLAESILSSDNKHDKIAIDSYHCSICSLCSAVCPVDAEPAKMFELLRNHAQDKLLFGLEAYSPLLKYEQAGTRFPFKDNILPAKCETAFFPGCTLPAMFPAATKAAYSALKKNDPSLGMILNCCSKPSKMLGCLKSHKESLAELVAEIESKGIKKILTACPNCHITFKEFSPSFEIVSIYEELFNLNIKTDSPWLKTITIHDPCVTRFESNIHESVRGLLSRAGVTCIEMNHSREDTLCCGEGGGVGFHNPGYARVWTKQRLAEAETAGVPMVTYCAGCANFLSNDTPVAHILDLLFVKRHKTARLPKFPFNYLNRLKLKISVRLP